MLLFRLLALLPLWVLYFLADFLCFVAFRVVGYRKRVVWQNLKNSFPEKSDQELRKIQKQFYKHLAEVFVETLKVLQISDKELKKRIKIQNLDLLTRRLQEGRTVLVLTSHLFNWEWLSHIVAIEQKFPLYFVYQPLNNKFFDKLMLRLRTRFGQKAIKMQNVLKDILKNHNQARIVALLADQSPTGNEKDHWTTFLHQETAFFAGTEKIALKLQLPVLFGGVKRLKKGYYELYFAEIYHPKDLPSTNITETYAILLEKQICETPANWLWSHKRWKKKKNF
jgi:KDO2-lipid IV(A) lauroyltransferase